MTRSIVCLTALCLSLALPSPLPAEYRTAGPIEASEARRFGLEVAWTTRIEVDPARGRLVHIRSFVSSRDSHTEYVVQYGEGDRRRVFSDRDLNRFGELLGKAGAERAAGEFVQELKSRGLEGEVTSQEVPDITLYVTTDRGMVQAIDAENGRTLWATIVGHRDYPTERPGVNEDYVAVLNGTSLYLLTRSTGAVVWVRRTGGVPAAGPALSETYVVVPTYSGNVEVYEIEESRTLPEMYMSNGRALIQPTVTSLSIAWPTDRGYMYVARATAHGIRYRLETKNTIVAPVTYAAPNNLLVGSVDGYLYCLKETGNGEEVWRFSAGEGLVSQPVPTADTVYVVSERDNLFAIDRESGQLRWMAPGVTQFLARSSDRVYCLGTSDQIDILDAKTGGRIASMPPSQGDIHYTNLLTDRILVGTRTGVLQCLREIGQRWPLLHVALEKPEEQQRPEIRQEGLPDAKPKPQAAPPAGQQVDPFGNADPFGGAGAGGAAAGGAGAGGAGAGGAGAGGAGAGGAGAGAAGGSDPFGNSDPFGGGGGAGAGAAGGAGADGAGASGGAGAAGGGDPFGGSDPFGGGGAGAGGAGGGGAGGAGAGGAGAGGAGAGGAGAGGGNPDPFGG